MAHAMSSPIMIARASGVGTKRQISSTRWRLIAIDLIAELESRWQGRSGFAALTAVSSVPNE